MKTNTLFLLFSALVFSLGLHAQDHFITKGRIEFEKKVNIHRNMDAIGEDDPNERSWVDNYKKEVDQFKTTYFDLLFDGSKTLYRPGRDAPPSIKPVWDWFLGPARENIVFTDLAKQESVTQKAIFESAFLISDTSRQIDWKFSSDTRNIAGFECHKAIGKIMDSVYVIAFYADEIGASGGPESFCGLPGMILGVAIPRINTTWFATKVYLEEIKPGSIVPPKKGIKVDSKGLIQQIRTATKNWGKEGKLNTWEAML